MRHEDLADVRYAVGRGLARITIDRPSRCDASRARTVGERTFAAEHARSGPAGPRVRSFDAGFVIACLARIVGGKGTPVVGMDRS